MDTKFDLVNIRESTDLVNILKLLGYEPLRKSGGELFYLSMLRENDSSPSFCVNEKSGLWYDHGMGKGGSVIEFAISYWSNLPFKDAINELLKLSGQLPGEPINRAQGVKQTSLLMREPSYIIREVKPLGSNTSITNYLKSRGIFEVAQGHLKELYYSIKLQDNSRREVFAAAWQNELNGWEVRSMNFKGCLDKKAMSFIAGNDSKINLFEGMMDFLSWKKLFPGEPSSALILNTLSFLNPALERAKTFAVVELFFDHDKAGRKATAEALSIIPGSTDGSGFYAGYNDFNEKLQNLLSEGKYLNSSADELRKGPVR
ncbi:toprim domain-containing protein [Pedobacter jamesrossensis]|uniref:Toprim domain-containing protein n=1 Tax=Pedobacter jamesrossensis TaxID=1908238 RepID=A0ABV8NRZ6_9SPHI